MRASTLTVLLGDDHAKEALLSDEVPNLLGQVPVLVNLVVVQHLAQLFHLRSQERGGVCLLLLRLMFITVSSGVSLNSQKINNSSDGENAFACPGIRALSYGCPNDGNPSRWSQVIYHETQCLRYSGAQFIRARVIVYLKTLMYYKYHLSPPPPSDY